MNFSLLGICFDKTQTLRKGASKGPIAIRKTFPKLETFIENVDLSNHFIKDLGNINPRNLEEIENKLRDVDFKYFPVIIGGEHSITYSCVDRLKPKNIVILDAHPDMENKNDHSGVARKIYNIGINVFLYGIRAYSKDEMKFVKKNKISMNSLPDIKKIKGPTYLSIDFDVFDPSVVSSVGNPEPDGLSFNEIANVIKILAKKLVAVDFVEFTPANNDIDAIIAGKLIYRTLAEIIKANQ